MSPTIWNVGEYYLTRRQVSRQGGTVKSDNETRQRILSTANRSFAKEVVDYGNENLGHLGRFSETDVIKVLVALRQLAQARGREVESDVPEKPLTWYAPAKRLEWYEPEDKPTMAVRFEVWTTWVGGAVAGG